MGELRTLMASVQDACARQGDGYGCPWGDREVMALYNELQPGFVPGGDDDDDDAIDPDIFAAAAFKHGLFFPPVGRVA